VADITLCLIARDEEALLPGCLASVAGAVDRMVVVDTGSRDGTREVARSFGAEVVEHAWDDDFAAARNAGIAAVASGYLLVLDADERLAPGAAAALRAAVAGARPDLGLLPLHHASRADAEPAAVLAGEARLGEPQLLPRLLRRTRDLRYEGIVHESVARWAARQRRAIHVDAPIVHYGAVPDRRLQLAKAERNLRLLQRRCRSAPDDPIARAYLAAELRRTGQLALALAEARAALASLRRERRCGRRHHDVVFPLTIAVELLLRSGALDEAEAVLLEGSAWAEHPNLSYYAGIVAESRYVGRGHARERLDEAARHYQCAVALGSRLFSAEVVPGAGGWGAWLRLGTVELLRGNAEAAASSYARALAQRPDLREARLGACEAKIAAGDPAGALRALEPLFAEPDADAWLLAAQAARASGADADARVFLERARAARALRPFVARHREGQWIALERALGGRPLRVFAWPHWRDDALVALLATYGPLLANRDDTVLCLRHDAALDGPAPEAVARLEAAWASVLPPESRLDVLLLDDEYGADAGAAGVGDLALELPGCDDGPRHAFLAGLAARRIASPADLAAALGTPAPL
jgi:hypothetical protein